MHSDHVQMTSQPGEVEEHEPERSAGQDEDQGATSALTVERVELADKKDAITDGVIRQLIDQIAQLQRVAYKGVYTGRSSPQPVGAIVAGSPRQSPPCMHYSDRRRDDCQSVA